MNKKIYYKDRFIDFKDIATVTEPDLKKVLKTFISGTENIILPTGQQQPFFELMRKKYYFITAAGGLIKKGEGYLFIFRHQKWDLPKGKLEKNELPEVAAIRECEEECGVKELNIIRPLPFTYHLYEYKGSLALKQTYWYLMETNYAGVLTPQEEESITAVEWFKEDKIRSEVMQNSYHTITDLLIDTFGLVKQ
jgi:8-oxo-dGTP pyrophosphatase MutT (NUDIX family)